MAPAKEWHLLEHFGTLRDRRVRGRSDHELLDIVVIVLCGTIAGLDDFVSIADYARSKETWLKERLGLKLRNGVPSHDTLNRVFALIVPGEFQECFLGWVALACERMKIGQIAIDGKALRGSRQGASQALHIVSAWATKAGLTLAQVRTEEKSNEIAAIPDLLDILDISGALVSIDAAGCQKEIAAKIVDKKGHYLLAVKDNQPRLREDIERLATAALEADYAGLSQHTTKEKGHGREEFRFAFVMTDLTAIRDLELWKGLKSLVCVVRQRTVNGEESCETQYYVSSKKASAKYFLQASRAHWGVENPHHWVLDVAFDEDDCRLREGHAPENMALVRKIALMMLNRAPEKMGIKNRRKKAGYDDEYHERVLLTFPGV
jgi:predicted transposase YbfD/YdcC